MRFKGCLNFWLGGLITAIFLNYLITGFIDFVLNIQSVLDWLQQNEQFQTLLRTFF